MPQTFYSAEQKIAKSAYPIHTLIANRWSPRAFDTKRAVETEKLFSILEASRWAASSFNEQPWRLIVGDKFETPETHQLIQQCLVDGNKWAFEVPVLIMAVAKNNFTQTGAVNRHALHDVGLALGNLAIQATALGLYAHMMAGFYPEKAIELFNIPAEDFSPVVVIALGYLGDPKQLKEQWQQGAENAARTRKPLQEIIYAGQWNRPYPGLFS